jgi:hypothetical protein
MAHPPTVRELEALLEARRFHEVIERGGEMSRRGPGSLQVWVMVARAAIAVGRLGVADKASASALKLAAGDHEAELLRAIVDHRLARTAEAVDRARRLIDRRAPNAADAAVVLAEALYRTGQMDGLRALAQDDRVWSGDPRAAVYAARAEAIHDPAVAARRFEEVARGSGEAHLRRAAGFDAVRLLDAAGRYREAFDLAAHVHATTGSAFDIGGLADDIAKQRELLARGRPWFTARAPRVSGTCMVVGMPRSGTTLLEQMLDRHPGISGIGEYEGLQQVGSSLVSAGVWPCDIGALEPGAGAALQREYLEGARSLARHGAEWTFDKALHAWRLLPAVAAVLPGAVCIWMARDPRDTAISLFLSSFHPSSFGWTSSLEKIRTVMELERAVVPEALAVLGIEHEPVVYENLVADPSGTTARCLARMGLPMDDATLSPEANVRTVLTLSHQQVRAPINRGSIGRWRNYEWAFDGTWRALADAHGARVLA